jgi:uncharacterized protein
VADVDAALAGARDIVAEIVAENATVRAAARQIFAERGELVSKAVPKNTKQPTKFEQYYDFREPVKTIPSHRFWPLCAVSATKCCAPTSRSIPPA